MVQALLDILVLENVAQYIDTLLVIGFREVLLRYRLVQVLLLLLLASSAERLVEDRSTIAYALLWLLQIYLVAISVGSLRTVGLLVLAVYDEVLGSCVVLTLILLMGVSGVLVV